MDRAAAADMLVPMGKPEVAGIRFKDLAAGERPQERLENLGPEALSDTELLAMILRSGTRKQDVLALAASILRQAGSLRNLLSWSREDFARMDGIGPVKSLQLITVIALARRVLRAGPADPKPRLDDPLTLYQHVQPLLGGLSVEKFYVCALDRKNHLIREIPVTSGTATSSLVHPREVFREAIRCNATAVVAVHNHPSGDPSPSSADIRVTRQLRDAARILDIEFLDHLVVGSPDRDPRGLGYYSFNEAGLV